MSDASMIERVARAICTTECGGSGQSWRMFEDQARAAIAAMREPDDAMLEAAAPEPFHLYGADGRDEEYRQAMQVACTIDRMGVASQFRTMIDAALATPTSPHSSPPKDVETQTAP